MRGGALGPDPWKKAFRTARQKVDPFRERDMILSPPEAAAGRATSRTALAGFVRPLAKPSDRAAHIIRKKGRTGIGG